MLPIWQDLGTDRNVSENYLDGSGNNGSVFRNLFEGFKNHKFAMLLEMLLESYPKIHACLSMGFDWF